MQGFWLKFTDGSAGYCEGSNAYDAKVIAEKLTGKTVSGETYKPDAKTLPYPASPVIWQLDHPVTGKCPAFCFKPNQCAGHGSCPQDYSCTE
ncbi:hypothetical protein EAH88_11680 [Rhodanobacter glycinis]|uniref:Uncharacterized protein n=1 Tax=Rhodanobacter glycinis TaxID=582702 RepID=A0A502C542_9GAMM|nr:hypothetical protein [Rhodanobacter glycinis]TPG08287.1 hypothetical protein EAH88_11680 [Rhodanobacter glycinis]